MVSLFQSEISEDFMTVIPLEIREKFNLQPGNIMKWTIVDNAVKVSFHRVIYLSDMIASKNKGDD